MGGKQRCSRSLQELGNYVLFSMRDGLQKVLFALDGCRRLIRFLVLLATQNNFER